MTGLERGVLAIVGEAEKLPRVLTQPGVGTVHPAQNTADEHGGSGGAALGRERGEARAVARASAPRVAAAKAEAELARQEPDVRSRTDAPVGGDQETPGPGIAVVRFESRAAVGGKFDPSLGIVVVVVGEREGGIFGRMRGEEPELPLRMRLVRFTADLGLLGRRQIIDVAREECQPFFLLNQPHRMVLVTALATEMHGVQALVGVFREKLLAFNRHRALAGRFDGRVAVPGAGNELVKLEGEKAIVACAFLPGPFPLRDARHEKELFQSRATGVTRAPGIRRELVHRLGYGHWLRPDPALVGFGERDAEARLHPNRQRVLPERRIGNLLRHVGINGRAEAVLHRVCRGAGIGNALERLADHVAFADRRSEEL